MPLVCIYSTYRSISFWFVLLCLLCVRGRDYKVNWTVPTKYRSSAAVCCETEQTELCRVVSFAELTRVFFVWVEAVWTILQLSLWKHSQGSERGIRSVPWECLMPLKASQSTWGGRRVQDGKCCMTFGSSTHLCVCLLCFAQDEHIFTFTHPHILVQAPKWGSTKDCAHFKGKF